MINTFPRIENEFKGSHASCNSFSFCFANIRKSGDLTKPPRRAEEWTPSSAYSFKQEEVVAYEIDSFENGGQK
jgi:hypothetical protein